MNICQNHQQQTSISSVGFQLQKSLRNKNWFVGKKCLE
jgi:hypothetical protein